jgi:hypothetical protein
MDPNALKLGQQALVPKRTRPKAPRRQSGEKFLKGPVPLNWLGRAAQLPGKSLHVGAAFWFLKGLCRTDTVTLSNGILAAFGVDRHAKYRALNCLEQAGLIRCERHTGRSPRVTILVTGDVK